MLVSVESYLASSSMHLLISKSCARLMCVALWPCKCSLSRDGIYRLTGREPAAQPGQHASVEMNQAVRDSRSARSERTLRVVPITRGKRLVCDPAGDSRRISSPGANPAALSSKGATCGRSPSRDAVRRAHGTGTMHTNVGPPHLLVEYVWAGRNQAIQKSGASANSSDCDSQASSLSPRSQ